MEAHTLLALMVCPFMEQTVPWADDTWAFVQWGLYPSNVQLEYFTFRELALYRKKCLTVAQYTVERMVESGDEGDRMSMLYFVSQAERIEHYMRIMMYLGRSEWTRYVDESMWPDWACAGIVLKYMGPCMANDACAKECDNWAMQQVRETGESELDEWRARARVRVADHWIQLTRAVK